MGGISEDMSPEISLSPPRGFLYVFPLPASSRSAAWRRSASSIAVAEECSSVLRRGSESVFRKNHWASLTPTGF